MKNISTPLTLGLLVSLAVAFVVSWIPDSPLVTMLALFTDPAAMRPWTFLTYPWAVPGDGNALFFFLLMGLWLWGIGGQIERSTNARTGLPMRVLTSPCGWGPRWCMASPTS